MTITSEIQRIKSNISACYSVCSEKGATLPSVENSNNLALTIESIPSGADVSKIYTVDMAEEVLKNLLNGNSGDFYIGGQKAIDILNDGSSFSPLGDNWIYAVKDVNTYYDDILTSGYAFTIDKLTNVIGEINE